MKKTKDMTDDEMYEILTQFGQEHTLSQDIKFRYVHGCMSLIAKDSSKGAKYEDAEMLKGLVDGAWHFLMWARRNHIVRFGRGKK